MNKLLVRQYIRLLHTSRKIKIIVLSSEPFTCRSNNHVNIEHTNNISFISLHYLFHISYYFFLIEWCIRCLICDFNIYNITNSISYLSTKAACVFTVLGNFHLFNILTKRGTISGGIFAGNSNLFSSLGLIKKLILHMTVSTTL